MKLVKLIMQINTTIQPSLCIGKFHLRAICNRHTQKDSTNTKHLRKTLRWTTSQSQEFPFRLIWNSTSPIVLIFWLSKPTVRMIVELFKEMLSDGIRNPSSELMQTLAICQIRRVGSSQVLLDLSLVKTCPNALDSQSVLSCSNLSSTSVPTQWELKLMTR